PDRSVRFGGPRPATDVYTVTAHTELRGVTAVRLEVLTDALLPHKGPGRQDNGNLHLNEFRVSAGPRGGPAGPAAGPPATVRLQPGRLDGGPRHRRQPPHGLGPLPAGGPAARGGVRLRPPGRPPRRQRADVHAGADARRRAPDRPAAAVGDDGAVARAAQPHA